MCEFKCRIKRLDEKYLFSLTLNKSQSKAYSAIPDTLIMILKYLNVYSKKKNALNCIRDRFTVTEHMQ